MVTASVRGATLKKNSKEMVKESGESVLAGLTLKHAYSVHGVTQKQVTIGEKTVIQYFVIVKNPWNENTIRNYEKDTMKPFLKSVEDRNAADYETKGLFLVELRDFYYSFAEMNIEKKE